MISIGRQYGVRSPMVAQYHPIRAKKACLFNKITRYCIMSPSRSRRRHTAQEQPFDVLIQYPLHPRAGERVVVVRRLHHGGSIHFVVEQPDSTRALLPAWMTEPWAARLTIIEMPRLTLEALHGLRSAINGALLSLSSWSMMRGKCDDGATSRPPAARSARARGQRARTKPNTTTDSGGSDVSASAADGGVPRRRYGAAGRGQQ